MSRSDRGPRPLGAVAVGGANHLVIWVLSICSAVMASVGVGRVGAGAHGSGPKVGGRVFVPRHALERFLAEDG